MITDNLFVSDPDVDSKGRIIRIASDIPGYPYRLLNRNFLYFRKDGNGNIFPVYLSLRKLVGAPLKYGLFDQFERKYIEKFTAISLVSDQEALEVTSYIAKKKDSEFGCKLSFIKTQIFEVRTYNENTKDITVSSVALSKSPGASLYRITQGDRYSATCISPNDLIKCLPFIYRRAMD